MLPLRQRFESKIRITPGCWIWLGSKQAKGYGQIKLDRSSKNEKAHRSSYRLYVGEIPNGLFVLHRCDNPSCVNPDHLFLGTNEENMKDMVSKGRGNGPRGEENFKAKLTCDKVRSIRLDGRNRKTIAMEYQIHPATVWAIQTEKTWRHV